MAGTIAFLIFKSVQILILDTEDPFANAKKFVPGYMFLVGFVIAMVTFLKGLKHVGLDLSFQQSLLFSSAFGVVIALLGTAFLRGVDNSSKQRGDVVFDGVERVFAVLMVFTACAMAFAHGSNDVANAIGPLSVIIGLQDMGYAAMEHTSIPIELLLFGA